jgi:hypothetical protein
MRDPTRRLVPRDRVDSSTRLRLGEAGRPSSPEVGQATAPIRRRAGQKKTRIETLRRQAIEGTASTPRGLPSLERPRPLERSATAGPTKDLVDSPGPRRNQVGNGTVQADPAPGVFGHPVGSPSRRASRGWLPNQPQGSGACAHRERLGQCSLRAEVTGTPVTSSGISADIGLHQGLAPGDAIRAPARVQLSHGNDSLPCKGRSTSAQPAPGLVHEHTGPREAKFSRNDAPRKAVRHSTPIPRLGRAALPDRAVQSLISA